MFIESEKRERTSKKQNEMIYIVTVSQFFLRKAFQFIVFYEYMYICHLTIENNIFIIRILSIENNFNRLIKLLRLHIMTSNTT
jgi:hypothetical protein